MAWHILQKDWKLMRWLVLALGTLQFLLAAARWKVGQFPDIRQLTIPAGPVGSVLLFLISGFVIAVAVHQDAIPGVRQDWLVRPIKRTDLLLAKFLFVLILIQGPMFVTDVLQGLANGFTFPQSFAPAVWRGLYVFFTFSIPVLALAALTRNLTEIVIAFVGALAAVLAVEILPSLGGWTSAIEATGVAWVPTLARQGFVFGAALAVLGMQYFRRKTIPACVLFAGALAMGQAMQFVPWSAAFGIEQSLSPSAGPSALALAFEPNLGRFRLALGQNADDVAEKPGMGPVDVAEENQRRRAEGAVTVFLPLRLTGLPAESLLIADRSEVRVAAERGDAIFRGEGNEFQVHGAVAHVPEVSTHQGLRIPRAIYERVKEQPARLEIDYSVTLFRLDATQEIPARSGDRRLRKIGWCGTRVDLSGTAIQFRCLQDGERPPCLRVALQHTPTGARNPEVNMCAPDYVPFPGHAVPDALSRFGGNLPFSDRSGLVKYPVSSERLGESQVIVKVYEPSAHLTRRLVIPAVRLVDWLPEAPDHER